jgi:CRISPR/Cas system-associated exonuclease Cas4 (RecB family)
MLIEKIESHLAEVAKGREPWTRIGASNAGQCPRKLWYTVHGFTPEPLQPRALRVFDLGDRIEDALISWLQDAGVDHVRCTREQDKVLLPEIGGNVVPDFFFEAGGELLVGEIKSMSGGARARGGFARAERGEIDESYLAQVECYMRAFGTARALFLCYCKDTSHLCEVLVERSDDRWEAIKANVALARGDATPDRPYSLTVDCRGCAGTGRTPTGRQAHKACAGTGREPGGPYIPNFPCGYCGFKAECWGRLEMVVSDDGKPKWRLAA